MNDQLQSKQNGGQSSAAEKQPPVTPSSGVGLTQRQRNLFTSDTSANSANQKNPIGFQTTAPSGLDPKTELAKTLVTLAGNLGDSVFWRSIELSDGQRIIALCFPVTSWTPDPDNGFIYKG